MFETEFIVRYAVFLISTVVLLRVIYFRVSPNREVYLGLFMFGNGVFFITYLLHSVEMSMGFAFGLFAVFSMLRYRTETISIRDMTYLFTTIVISLMCAVAVLPLLQLALLSGLILLLAGFAETHAFAPTMVERKITYDRVDKIHPDQHDALIDELRERTGMNIVKVDIGKINFLSDSVQLTVFCGEGRDGKKVEKTEN